MPVLIINSSVARRTFSSHKTMEDDEDVLAKMERFFPSELGGKPPPPPLSTELPPVINYRRQRINLNRKSRASQARRKR